jgi:hypothetical protein
VADLAVGAHRLAPSWSLSGSSAWTGARPRAARTGAKLRRWMGQAPSRSRAEKCSGVG